MDKYIQTDGQTVMYTDRTEIGIQTDRWMMTCRDGRSSHTLENRENNTFNFQVLEISLNLTKSGNVLENIHLDLEQKSL